MPKTISVPTRCTLCPRRCGADRAAGRTGFCGAGATLKAARAALHHWEEPFTVEKQRRPYDETDF